MRSGPRAHQNPRLRPPAKYGQTCFLARFTERRVGTLAIHKLDGSVRAVRTPNASPCQDLVEIRGPRPPPATRPWRDLSKRLPGGTKTFAHRLYRCTLHTHTLLVLRVSDKRYICFPDKVCRAVKVLVASEYTRSKTSYRRVHLDLNRGSIASSERSCSRSLSISCS